MEGRRIESQCTPRQCALDAGAFYEFSPGPVVTPQVAVQPPEAIARIVFTVRTGRMEEPEESAKVALFVDSDYSDVVTEGLLTVGRAPRTEGVMSCLTR
jgi:hypothetical protein